MLSSAAMRVRASLARPRVLSLALLALSLATPRTAHARRQWWWSRGGSKRAWSISVEGGLRYMTHYNQESVISTPPQSFMAEAQATFWYKREGGIYLLYSRAMTSQGTQIYGGGIKFPFLSLQGIRDSLIGGISMMLLADLGSYTFPQPVAPAVYPTSGLLFRYGTGISWGVGKTGFFLDTTMMVTTVNGNFFVAPLLGVGFKF